MIAASIAAVVMLAAVAAMLWSGTPLAARLGLPIGPVETPLKLVSNPIDRRDLDNGSELFAISGKVVNPTGEAQHVPAIRADLRDAQNRIVFSWTIRPEATSLPPKGSVEFNSANLDVPVNSKTLALTFSGDAAR